MAGLRTAVVFSDRQRASECKDRGASAGRLGATQWWKSVRSQIKPCDTLFWLQLSARPVAEIHLASLNRLGARRANFVIDAWKPVVSKIGIAATIERLDPLHRLSGSHDGTQAAFRAGEIRVAAPRGQHGYFLPPQGEEDELRLLYGPSPRTFASGAPEILRSAGLKYFHSDRFLFGEELGRAASSAQYFVVSPREVIDPKTKTAYSPLSPRYFEGLAAGTRLLGPPPQAANTRRFCRPTPCVKCRSTVRIWPSVSIETDRTLTISARLTPPQPWCANIIPGVGVGSKSMTFLSMAARWIST